ncbi:hypothetical protein [Enterococcus caccae]|uniref:Lipoprotein n=1 Tax=Enterococcus caccae ATCC BAA-1240 TaxID=1158612 RepID=R3WAT8_9ENTE|nr:hypothetical protein [Enterococcus caccae]EOL44562.1 hypothetical protein UC7_02105 [Enterococcus caccae ATCC BAA-1240]EOT58705.1 hypothetical protein I580_02877 [Enterococcus caccae ATCC BAA-1240]OJG25949.1 hypothetical protein RU98_GL000826 [Enterococcus caccae]
MKVNGKYKKIIAACLILGGSVLFTGCSNSSETTAKQKNESNTSTQPTTETKKKNSQAETKNGSSEFQEIDSAQATKLLEKKTAFFIFYGKKQSKEYQHYQEIITKLPVDIAEQVYFMDEEKENEGELNKKYMFEMALEDGKYENVGVYFEAGQPKRIWGPTFEAEEIEELFDGKEIKRPVK